MTALMNTLKLSAVVKVAMLKLVLPCANSAPPTPAMMPLITNAVSLARTTPTE